MVMEPSGHCCCYHSDKRAIVFCYFLVTIKKACICLTQ